MTLWERRAVSDCVCMCTTLWCEPWRPDAKRVCECLLPPAGLILYYCAADLARQKQIIQLHCPCRCLKKTVPVSYLCCSLKSWNFCWEAYFLLPCCWLRFRALTGWRRSAQLSVITSAPCENSPSLCGMTCTSHMLRYISSTYLIFKICLLSFFILCTGTKWLNLMCVALLHLSGQQCVSTHSRHEELSLHPADISSLEWEKTGRVHCWEAGRACCFPKGANHHFLETREE